MRDTVVLDASHVAVHLDRAAAAPTRAVAAQHWRVLERTGDALRWSATTAPAPTHPPPLPTDAIAARVINRAVPIPRRPNGVQYEARARPSFERTHAGQAVGTALDLDVGIVGFTMNGTLAWTGTRFLYAYRSGDTAMLLPIDCR